MKVRWAAASAAATLVALTALVMQAALPANAALPNGPAASADAYGLMVDVQLLPAHVPVRQAPVARSAQDFPPGAAAPAENQVLEAGPLPADGSVVNHVGVLITIAGATGEPRGVASAQAVDVSLLKQNGTPLISADLVRAQANSDCETAPNSTGTTFVNLKVNGQLIDESPDPNTTIDLVVAKVILNEQRPAFDGRGIVVNAIHVISTTEGDPLFRGDVIVAHAMSTVSCPDGDGSTGGDNPIKFVKTASPSVARPGDQVTYTASVTNSSTEACIVNQFIDHLSPAFEFVSTAGDFGTALDRTENRPGGGVDLILGNGKTIPAGGTFNQTFVVKVKEGAAPGVYYNNLEILCANLGDFVKGLDAPVQVPDDNGSPTPTASPSPIGEPTDCSDAIDNDGDGQIDYPADAGCDSPDDDSEQNDDDDQMPRTGVEHVVFALGGLGLLGAAVLTRRVQRAH